MTTNYYAAPDPQRSRLLPLFAQVFSGRRRVLDIGSADGGFVESVNGLGTHGIGVDLDEERVERARARGLDVRCADLVDFVRTTEERFDGIHCCHVLEHLPHEVVDTVMSSLPRICEEQALVVIVVPNPHYLPSFIDFWNTPDHIRPYTRSSIVCMLSYFGFRVDDSLPVGAFWRDCGARLAYRARASEPLSVLRRVRRKLRRMIIRRLGLQYCADRLSEPHDAVVCARKAASSMNSQ